MKFLLSIICSAIFLFIAPTIVQAQVIVNEVMANPVTSGDKSEWVELLNYSPAPVDLGGWLIDSAQFPANTIIPAHEYLVVTKSAADFTAEFGNIPNALQLNISLSNSGDTVILSQGAEVKDSLTYTAAVEAKSWQRAGATCFDLVQGDPHTLAASNTNYSEDCFPDSPPQSANPIHSILFSTDQINWAEEINIIGPTTLYARAFLSGGNIAANPSFILDDDREFTSSIYLDSYVAKTLVVKVKEGETTWEKESKQLTVLPKLQITEVMANPDGSDTGKEWVEIFNPNSFAVSLDKFELHDSQGKVLAFTTQDSLAPGQYAVISLPGYPLLNCTAGSGCSESVILKFQNLLVDQMSYQVAKSGQSLSFDPGRGTWVDSWQITPGIANAPRPQVSPPPAVIPSTTDAEDAEEVESESELSSVEKAVVQTVAQPNPHKLPSLQIYRLSQAEKSAPFQIHTIYIPVFQSLLVLAAIFGVAFLYRQGIIERYVAWWLRS